MYLAQSAAFTIRGEKQEHVKSDEHLLYDELSHGWSMPIILVLLSIYLQSISR